MALISALISFLVYFALPPSVPELARRTLGIFTLSIILWVSEAVPLYAVSMLAVCLEIIFLYPISAKNFFAPFGSDIIILFMGGFVLSKAISKHRAGEMLASRLIAPFAHSPTRLIFAVLFVTAISSMWMSNSATAAMMFAILSPALKEMPHHFSLRSALIVAVAFGANIGGIGTPVGSPPNAICLAALRSAGHSVSFLQWMLAAVPLMLILLVIAGIIICRYFKPAPDGNLHLYFKTAQPLGKEGWMVFLIMGSAVVLWLSAGLHGMNEGAVALLAATALAVLGLVDRSDIISIDWDILILMWGGLTFSYAMTATGLTDWVAALPFSHGSRFSMDALFILGSIGLSTLMSNTAAANILIPLAVTLSKAEPVSGAILAAMGTSLDIALPISTPPNAIAFSHGGITVKQMLTVSLWVTPFSILLLFVWSRYVLPAIFG